MSNIRLVIADDHTLFINGLQLLLKEESGIEITDIANDGKELMGLIHQRTPDMVLLDINMPEMNGLDAVRYIKQSCPSVKIIMLSTYNEDHLIEKAKQYGANGYLLKNSSKEELLNSIRLVADGHSCFPYRSPKNNNDFDNTDNFIRQFNLTRRESEILQLLKNGSTNAQISTTLFLSIYTVETHRKNIMQKLNLKTPAELIKFIIKNNI